MENTKKHSDFPIRKVLITIFIVILAAIPVVFLILPANYFDGKESICLSQVIFETECYGCGMTKAIQHLIHFYVSNALKYNYLSIIVLPLIAYLWLKNLIILYLKQISKQ
jgi:hypothetical protein